MPRVPLRLLVLVFAASACSTDPAPLATTAQSPTSTLEATTAQPAIPVPPDLTGELAFEIVGVYPHLTTSFTQGLEFLDNGQLVESLGLRRQSGRAIVDLESGEHLAFVPLERDQFGEGVTQVGEELFQLTWLDETLIVSDSESLAETRTASYSGQGWGLCWTGNELAMSDGSQELAFRDPADFSAIRRVPVTSDRPELLGQFNELECVGNQIWANVFQQNHIVAINPDSGEVEAWVNLDDLEPDDLRNNDDRDDVLNGIAYRPETGTFFVTGKLWPEMFELRLFEN